jgi:isopentenyl-diphosphate Delta-isomerase
MEAGMAGRFAVVDDQNRFLRWVDRKELHLQHLPHRSVQVLMFDSQNRLILQLRHRDKDTYAHYWDLAACGHVEESDYLGGPDEKLDEVYKQVAFREVEEELGVLVDLQFLEYFPPIENVHYEHFYLYKGITDGPFTLQEEEVEDVKTVTSEQMAEMVADPEQKLTRTLLYMLGWMAERKLWS